MDFIPVSDFAKRFSLDNEDSLVKDRKKAMQKCLYAELQAITEAKKKQDEDFILKMVPLRLAKDLLTLNFRNDGIVINLNAYYLNASSMLKTQINQEIKSMLCIKGYECEFLKEDDAAVLVKIVDVENQIAELNKLINIDIV
jgi:hypothetical protein